MRNTKGAIIYDGWSRNDLHLTAIIASYCTKCEIKENCTSKTISIPRLILLAISPMSQVSDEDKDNDCEATSFNAESYIQFINETFAV